jgi:hypothetical protein
MITLEAHWAAAGDLAVECWEAPAGLDLLIRHAPVRVAINIDCSCSNHFSPAGTTELSTGSEIQWRRHAS